jgi:ABC-type glycerol-3-phosphate transport system substrate-binding protein
MERRSLDSYLMRTGFWMARRYFHRHAVAIGAITAMLSAVSLLVLGSGCTRSAAAGARTEIRYCFFGGFEDWRMWRTVAAEFERANPDVAVRLLYWPGSN